MKLRDYINNNAVLTKVVMAFAEIVPDASIFQSEDVTGIDVEKLETIEDCKMCQIRILHCLHEMELSKRTIWQYSNVLSIIAKSLPTLLKAQQPEKNVAKSWMARFFDLCKECDNEEIQEVWVKLLNNELLQEDHVFKRTLTVLDNLEKFEYEWFVDFCRFTIDNAYVYDFILEENKYFPFNKFQTLIDCGLLNPTLGGIAFDKSQSLKVKGHKLNLTILKDKYQASIYTLTDAGSQLCETIDVEASIEYLNQLKEIVAKAGTATLDIIDN